MFSLARGEGGGGPEKEKWKGENANQITACTSTRTERRFNTSSSD